MLKNQKYFLLLLKTVSVVSFINVVVVWWLPYVLPLSSFTIVQNARLAFISGRNGAVAVSLLLCVLLYWTAVSIRKQHILWPLLSLLYLLFDCIHLLRLLTDGRNNGYWFGYSIAMVLSLALLVPLGKYCWNRVGNKPHSQE